MSTKKGLRNKNGKRFARAQRRHIKNKFQKILRKSRIAITHPYCILKGIHPIDIRVRNNQLLIPMHDEHGELVGIQRIGWQRGDYDSIWRKGKSIPKPFIKGSILRGSYFEIGQVKDIIYIAEGFADAQSIYECTGELSVVAFSCNNLVRVAEIFTEKYSEAEIIIAGDADVPGIKNANEAASITKSMVVFPCDDMGSETLKDFNDLYRLQGMDAVIRQLECAEYIEDADIKKLNAVSVGKFIKMPLPRRIYLLKPIIETQSLIMLHAYRGVGKTYLALEIAVAIASGTNFLHWRANRPSGVLYVDGEMPGHMLQGRLRKMTQRLPSANLPLRIITPVMQSNPMPDLATDEGTEAIEQHITDLTKLIILDNLSTLVRSGVENDAQSWQPFQDWILKMRRDGIAVFMIHHSGKGKLQRGTSKREDVLDTVLCLERPDDYSADQGARFIINFEKSRTMHGSDTMPFEVQLREDKAGNYIWETGTAMPQRIADTLELAQEGKSRKEIAEELGINVSTVRRRLIDAEKYQDTPE